MLLIRLSVVAVLEPICAVLLSVFDHPITVLVARVVTARTHSAHGALGGASPNGVSVPINSKMLGAPIVCVALSASALIPFGFFWLLQRPSQLGRRLLELYDEICATEIKPLPPQ
jgi:hypothetical protein